MAMNSDQCRYQQRDDDNNIARHNGSYIRLDIKVDTLQKLINNSEITIDQIHCVDYNSKAAVKQAMLNSIKRQHVN
jgi:hypothetical protein